jgi:hypothetical protein
MATIMALPEIPNYTVHLFCGDCWQLHTLRERVEIENLEEEFAKLVDIYTEKQMPAEIVDLLNQPITCPQTDRDKADPDMIYITRAGTAPLPEKRLKKSQKNPLARKLYATRELRASLLFAQHDPVIRTRISAYLTTNGYQVTEVANGAQGLAAIQQKQFDLVIASVTMPYLSGFELAEVLENLSPKVPVILLPPYLDGRWKSSDLAELMGKVKLWLRMREEGIPS